jgi:RES domain-containing protein
MTVYRISDCRYITDISGIGAAKFGGRWNNKEVSMLYTAQSAALALLETVVHMGKIPDSGFCMVLLELPPVDLLVIQPDNLPTDWFRSPGPDFLKKIGDNFIQAGKHLAMAVPSVIIPEEQNILINPMHKDFGKIKIKSQRNIKMDERLFNPNFALGTNGKT